MQTFLRFLLTATLALVSINGISDEMKHATAYIETSKGEITIALNPEKAPITVENFIRYAESGFYNDTIFHRVMKEFVIQGGGLTADMQSKKTEHPIHNESDNGIQNTRGTISMARTQDPDSATSQFFINMKDNLFLDYNTKRWGYTVFGKVVDGMDVAEEIASVSTGQSRGHSDVPREAIVIKTVRIERKEAKSMREKIKSSLQKKMRNLYGIEDS